MKNIPLLIPDLPSTEEVFPYLQRIDEARWYTNFGPLVKEYEHSLDEWLTQRSGRQVHAVTVNSGTAAIEIALSALDLPERARILVPAFTFVATATAVTRMGYTPVFTDVDADSWQLTPGIAFSIAEKTKLHAVITVATFGVPHETDAWDDFTNQTGLPVIIDAAAGLVSQDIGKHTICAYSLHATKPLGVGEGGVVISSKIELIKRIRSLTNFGLTDGLALSVRGTNGKLSEYHAAVGLAQLQRRTQQETRYREIADRYLSAMKHLSDAFVLQSDWHNQLSFCFPMRIFESALRINHSLAEKGIQTRCWYSPSLVNHPVFTESERIDIYGGGDLEVSNTLGMHVLGLPFYTRLDEDDMDYIVSALAEVLGI